MRGTFCRTRHGLRYTNSAPAQLSKQLSRISCFSQFCRFIITITATTTFIDVFMVASGRLLDERDFQPPALAEGESEAGFSQMPFDTQMGTQGGTQANLLTRFGAVGAPKRATAGKPFLFVPMTKCSWPVSSKIWLGLCDHRMFDCCFMVLNGIAFCQAGLL